MFGCGTQCTTPHGEYMVMKHNIVGLLYESSNVPLQRLREDLHIGEVCDVTLENYARRRTPLQLTPQKEF